jgi:hypothetical protein
MAARARAVSRVDLAVGTYVVAVKKKKLMLRGPSWSVVVGRGDDRSGAALAVDGARVFVASYIRLASSCQLAAFDAASGKPLWSVDLDGIGPIGHSAYGNRVQLRIIGGHPTVFGNEWAKRYVEQRDAATGALVSHRLLPPEAPPLQISEWLFYEIDLMLRKQPEYTLEGQRLPAAHRGFERRGPRRSGRCVHRGGSPARRAAAFRDQARRHGRRLRRDREAAA